MVAWIAARARLCFNTSWLGLHAHGIQLCIKTSVDHTVYVVCIIDSAFRMYLNAYIHGNRVVD